MADARHRGASFGRALRAHLLAALGPTSLLVAVVSVAMLAALLVRNPSLRDPSDAAVLLLYLLGLHVALVGPLAVGTLLVCAALPGRLPRRCARWLAVAVPLAGLLALNAGLRFTLTYTVYRGGAHRLVTPLGVLNHAVLLGGVGVVAFAVWGISTRSVSRLRVMGAVLAWAAAAAFVLVLNVRAETPRVPPVETVRAVAPAPVPAAWREARLPEHVLVLGFDGLSWFVVDALMRDGRLPHLAALVRSGARARLESLIPTSSPMIWTSIATGRTARDHGIFAFRRFRLPGVEGSLSRGPLLGSMNWWNGVNRALDGLAAAGLAERVPFFRTDRRVAAVWDVAARHGVSVGVVGWHASWPARALPAGSYMVSDFSGRDVSLFPADELEQLLAEQEIPPVPLDAASFVFGDAFLERQTRKYQRHVWKAIRLHERLAPRLSMNYWHYTDAVHHGYWRGEDRGRLLFVPHDADYRRFPPQLRDVYALVDHWIGAFLRVTDPDTLVVVLSDHGYAFDATEHHRAPDGFFVAAGPGVVAGAAIDDVSVYDVAPTLLAVLGLPVSDALEGRVRADVFRPGVLPEPRRVAEYGWYEPGTLDARRSTEVEEETFEQLRALGYVN